MLRTPARLTFSDRLSNHEAFRAEVGESDAAFSVQESWLDFALDLVEGITTADDLPGADDKGKTRIPEALRWEVWERDNFTCHYCGVRRFLTIDHIYPESLGGPTERRNLVTACARCNTSKGTRIPEDLLSQAQQAGIDFALPSEFPGSRAYRDLMVFSR